MKNKITKKEFEAILKIQDRIEALRKKFDEDNDVTLPTAENGTVAGNLSCASAALETILQDYFDEYFC